MITTVVFDIGNVLARFGWKEYLQSCIYNEEISQKIANATVLSDVWKEWDRGVRKETDLIEIACMQAPEVEKEIREFFDHALNLVQEYDYSVDFVKQLKVNGYKVYLLSNYSRYMFEHDKEKYEFIKYVDGGVISYEVLHIKPEPEIYEALINKYDLDPKEAVFIDDLQENLEGAEVFGFHTILKQTYEQVLTELRAMGVRI